MGHPRSLPVVIGVLGASAATFLGCGGSGASGDGGDGDARRRSTTTEPTTTTAAPAAIDLSQPIPGGSLHGTPRPPLENTGDDYVAIFESLVANFRWLTENPDPAVISELYVPGTEDHDTGVANFEFLTSNRYRWADEGYSLVSVDIVDVMPELVSLRFTDSIELERVIDANGMQVGEARPRSPQTKSWTVLLVPDAAGLWRIADVMPTDGRVVEL